MGDTGRELSTFERDAYIARLVLPRRNKCPSSQADFRFQAKPAHEFAIPAPLPPKNSLIREFQFQDMSMIASQPYDEVLRVSVQSEAQTKSLLSETPPSDTQLPSPTHKPKKQHIIPSESADSASSTKHRKGKWTDDEDALLLKLVEKYGPSSWGQISIELAGRTERQCRNRWIYWQRLEHQPCTIKHASEMNTINSTIHNSPSIFDTRSSSTLPGTGVMLLRPPSPNPIARSVQILDQRMPYLSVNSPGLTDANSSISIQGAKQYEIPDSMAHKRLSHHKSPIPRLQFPTNITITPIPTPAAYPSDVQSQQSVAASGGAPVINREIMQGDCDSPTSDASGSQDTVMDGRAEALLKSKVHFQSESRPRDDGFQSESHHPTMQPRRQQMQTTPHLTLPRIRPEPPQVTLTNTRPSPFPIHAHSRVADDLSTLTQAQDQSSCRTITETVLPSINPRHRHESSRILRNIQSIQQSIEQQLQQPILQPQPPQHRHTHRRRHHPPGYRQAHEHAPNRFPDTPPETTDYLVTYPGLHPQSTPHLALHPVGGRTQRGRGHAQENNRYGHPLE